MAIWHKKIWSGIGSVVDNPTILKLLQQWEALPKKRGLPSAEQFEMDRQSETAKSMMVLQAQGGDFIYYHYGSEIMRHAANDMTGRKVSDFGGELSQFFAQCYNEVLLKNKPLYAVHFSDRARTVFTWERLILPLRDAQGNNWLIVHNVPLESRHQLLEAVLNSTSDGILALRPMEDAASKKTQWLVLMANSQLTQMMGITVTDPIGRFINDILPQWGALGLQEHCQAVMQQPTGKRFEFEATFAGNWHYFSAHVGPLAGGCVIRLSDITESKRSQIALAERENRFRLMFEKTADAMMLLDAQTGLLLDFNEAALAMLGKSDKQELIGLTTAELSPATQPNGLASANETTQLLAQTQDEGSKRFEWVFRNRKSGDFYAEVLYTAVQMGGQKIIIATLRDISRRKAMEDELRRNNRVLQTVLDTIPSGLSVFDKDLYLVAENKRFRQLLDFPDSLFDKPVIHFEDFIRHNANRGEYGPGNVDAIVDSIVEKARVPKDHQIERVRPSGITLDIRGLPMPDGGFVTTYTDITDFKAANQGVRDSEERLQRALTASRLSLWDYNIETDGLYLSESWSELLGGPSVPTHTTFTQLGDQVPPEDQKAIVATMSSVLQGFEQSYSIEHRVNTLDGKQIWIRSEGKVVERDAEGNPTRALGTNRDITMRKEAEQTLHQTTSLLSSVLDAAAEVSIVATNTDQVFTVFNQGAERLLGYKSSDVVGQKMTTLASVYDQQQLMERGAEMAKRLGRRVAPIDILSDEAKLGQEIEWKATRKDGSRFTMALTVNALRSDRGELLGHLSVGRDVTAQRDYEQSLKDAMLAAEQLASAKSSFLATMSHEIRTPMNGVIGMTSLLLETPLSKEQREFTEVIRTSGENLMVVINDILDYSKIESGKMELEKHPFDLQEGVESSIDLLALKAQEKRLDLLYLIDPDVPHWVHGDLPRLRQVMVNLISNALKFTERGEVLVTVKHQGARPTAHQMEKPDSPLTLEISVQDTGIGIPPEAMSRLFKAFSQVDSSTSRKYGGTGLGLAISKRLVEAMGGEMQVESVDGKGTRFYFTLPTTTAPAIARANVASPHDLQGKRVMLVDDNATNLRIISLQAQRWGMVPITFLRPQEAVVYLRDDEPCDLIITDMHMPEMDGVEFSTLVKGLRPDLPIVLLSSVNMRNSADAQLFEVVLTKPARQSSLFDAFMRALPEGSHPPAAKAIAKNSQFDPDLGKRLPLRILLAEDNDVNQKLALRVLQGFGYLADVAANGLEAVDALKRQDYDLVLMDIQMPEMDGLQATRLIVSTWAANERPRIVAMSANAMREDIEAAKNAGMDDYITKPITIPALRAALEKWGGLRKERNASSTKSAKKLNTALADSNPPTQAPIDSDVLNMGQLASVNEMDPSGDFLGELVASFARNVPDLLGKLKVAQAAGNTGDMSRLGHQIKGLSGNLGATRLMKVSANLETIAKQGQLAQASALIPTIEKDFELSLAAFAIELKKLKNA